MIIDRVRLAKNTETSETVAIKVIEKEKIKKQNLVDQIKKEIAIMKSCKHRNIVTLKEVLASNSRVCNHTNRVELECRSLLYWNIFLMEICLIISPKIEGILFCRVFDF